MIDNTMVKVTAGITTLVVLGTALALGTARQGPSDNLAAAGSPLYGRVVRESIRTLDQQQGGPDAEKSDVCPDCGEVHAPAVGAGEVCPDCGQVHAPAAGASAAHGPAAASQPANAQALRLRQAARLRAQASAAAGAAGQPPRAVAPAADSRAFSHPAGGVCPDCGEIHPLPSAAHPGGTNPAVSPAVPANSYYCPDCKTYHARPVAGQAPVVNPHTPPLQLAE